MKQIRKILVCIDLSEYSKNTIEYALTFQHGFRAEIILLNIINKRDIETLQIANQYTPDKVDIDEYVENVRKDRGEKMYSLIRHLPREQQKYIQIELGEGVPFEEILKRISMEQVDLVIMGNKGRSNLASTLFGSTAEKVFKYADVPVVSIRTKT